MRIYSEKNSYIVLFLGVFCVANTLYYRLCTILNVHYVAH